MFQMNYIPNNNNNNNYYYPNQNIQNVSNQYQSDTSISRSNLRKRLIQGFMDLIGIAVCFITFGIIYSIMVSTSFFYTSLLKNQDFLIT